MTKEELKGTKIWFGEDQVLGEKIYNKLISIGAIGYKGGFGKGGHLMFIDNAPELYFHGGSNLIESKSFYDKISEKEITPSQLLGETDKQYKAGDWVLVKGRCGNGLPEDKILKLIEPDHRTVWGHCNPDYYFEWNNELKGLREEGIIRLARPEEIPQEEVEYCELIRDVVGLGEKGKIYPIKAGKLVEPSELIWHYPDVGRFKPSTREAYEAQQKNKYKGEWKVEQVKIKVNIEWPDKEVNKCSTINTNKNECKNEKGCETKGPLDSNTGAKAGQSIRPRTPCSRAFCQSGLLRVGKEITRTIKSSPRPKATIGRRFK